MVAYGKDKSLKDYLVRARIPLLNLTTRARLLEAWLALTVG